MSKNKADFQTEQTTTKMSNVSLSRESKINRTCWEFLWRSSLVVPTSIPLSALENKSLRLLNQSQFTLIANTRVSSTSIDALKHLFSSALGNFHFPRRKKFISRSKCFDFRESIRATIILEPIINLSHRLLLVIARRRETLRRVNNINNPRDNLSWHERGWKTLVRIHESRIKQIQRPFVC